MQQSIFTFICIRMRSPTWRQPVIRNFHSFTWSVFRAFLVFSMHSQLLLQHRVPRQHFPFSVLRRDKVQFLRLKSVQRLKVPENATESHLAKYADKRSSIQKLHIVSCKGRLSAVGAEISRHFEGIGNQDLWWIRHLLRLEHCDLKLPKNDRLSGNIDKMLWKSWKTSKAFISAQPFEVFKER